MSFDPMSTVLKRRCVWSATVMCFAILAIMVPMGFLPPPSPTWSAARIAEMYTNHRTAIGLGGLAFITLSVLYVPWAACLAAQARRVDGPAPYLTSMHLIFGTMCCLLTTLMGLMVGIAVFRAGEISAEITQTFNDLFWIIAEFTWPPFSAWAVVIAVTTFIADRNKIPLYPRWVGYLNLWCALLFMGGGLCIFFKTGPFAYDGIIAWWVFAVAFCVWIVGTAVAMDRVVQLEEPAAQGSVNVATGLPQPQPAR